MTGISGVKMWMTDYLMNKSSYPINYQNNFEKVINLYNECARSFKQCRNVKDCNDCYEEYSNRLDSLRLEIDRVFGRGRVPIGIGDTLDYLEEAIGDLEDKYLDKLQNMYVRVALPEQLSDWIKKIFKSKDSFTTKKFPDVHLFLKGKTIYAEGQYWDVRVFLEDLMSEDEAGELIYHEGEFYE